MDWRVKALGHWVISLSPRSDDLGYLMQRRVTKTLPMPEDLFDDHIAAAEHHVRLATEHLGTPPDIRRTSSVPDGTLSSRWSSRETGSVIRPLTDIRRLVRPELVADSAARLGMEPDLPALGITYLAPVDAMATGLPSNTFDLVTSTDTLEHVPRTQLVPLLSECRRLLRPGGVLTARIDYRDHYAYGDPSIGPFHFLRYGGRRWRRWNPPSHFQSRLRHVDHVRAIESAGLEVLAVEHPAPLTDALGLVHRDFDRYERNELAIPEAWIVARNPSGVA